MIPSQTTHKNQALTFGASRAICRIRANPGRNPQSWSEARFVCGEILLAKAFRLVLLGAAVWILFCVQPVSSLAAPASTEETPTPPSMEETQSPATDSVESQWPPPDHCLPPLYRNWLEFCEQERSALKLAHYSGAAIVIDLSVFRLELCGTLPNGTAEVIYECPIGAGSFATPTPTGQYVINHVYCYPDVLFFAEGNRKISGLYNGFFAPLLRCDENGACSRYREMGIHGFDSTVFPDRSMIQVGTQGAVSSGCIRLPNPCRFKSLLIALARVGPPKKNERGSFHWLRSPVDVFIIDNSPTILSLFEDGFDAITGALANILGENKERN